jgi:crossover junction endodeoxyribonuclease RuvC
MSRIITGLDLSLTGTGSAVIIPEMWRAHWVQNVETIRSKGSTADSLAQRYDRLRNLAERIVETIPDEGFPAVAIETPAHNQTSGHHHDRSGLWWLVVDRIEQWAMKVDIYEVSTTQVKKYATGKGNASKMEVMAAAIKRYPQFNISNDNEADAVVLAAFLARALGQPIEESLPAVQIEVVEKWLASQGGTA